MIPIAYKELLRLREVRRLLVVAMIARIPNTAAGLVLTLRIVQDLHRTYAEAGIVVAAFTLGVGIGSPWRGRLIDRIGLRRSLVPSIAVQAVVWPAMGFLSYEATLPVAFVTGLFAVPIFSIVRKSLSIMVEPRQRRTVFALDSVSTEFIFMVGPAIGTWTAMQFGPTPVLIVVGVASAGAGWLLWWYNPATSSPTAAMADSEEHEAGSKRWMSAGVVVVLAVSAAAALATAGTDVGVLAELRSLGELGFLGLAYAAWCLTSAIGGFIYGAWHRSISPLFLVLLLGVLTGLVAFANSAVSLILLLAVAGLACAPVVAACSDTLSHLVSEDRRGEALGWLGTAFTFGSAVGSPFTGAVIDNYGGSGGFAAIAALAVLVAGIGGLIHLIARSRRRIPGRVPVRY